MGYTLIIGEARIDYCKADNRLGLSVERASSPHAPMHDRFVGDENARSPSYIVWDEFCRDAGIQELFYGMGWDAAAQRYRDCRSEYHRSVPLLATHPGCQPICAEDLSVVIEARIERERTNGGKPPGFFDDDGNGNLIDNGTDQTLARLLWLEFWFDWALRYCNIPAIENF